MARQTYYLAKDVRHPLYKTRMLQAGPLELDASAARLYQRLGVELSDEAPKRAAAREDTAPPPVPNPPVHHSALPDPRNTREASKPAAKAPAKKAARRKKSK